MNRREHKNNRETKTCRICGDRSLGFNFNAITCESCKAFFRRNATKNKNVKCLFNGNCTIDVVTRRFCQSCRLRKCFEVGMKKEWILTEDEKRIKKAKIEENRRKRNHERLARKTLASSSTDESNGQGSPQSWTTNSSDAVYHSLDKCHFSSIEDNTYRKLVDAEYTILPSRNQLLHSTDDKRYLNALEHAKLQELIDANEILKLPLSTSLTPDSSNGSFMDVIRMTDHAIRRIIQMAKKLEGFRNLCQEDQVALLKGGCTELMILRSVMSYNTEKDCWQDSKSKMLLKLDVLKEANVYIYEAHKNFIHSFDVRLRNDENVMLLLTAITLFTPERVNIVHQELVKFEQYMYMHLLKRYLECTFASIYEAKSTYINLMSRVEELHVLNEDHVRIFLDISPDIVGPLLIEIFDLKN